MCNAASCYRIQIVLGAQLAETGEDESEMIGGHLSLGEARVWARANRYASGVCRQLERRPRPRQRSRSPSSTLASLFKQPSPRSPVPPSAFPTGLQPVASKDLNGPAGRRVSRTDLDFEQALRAGGTVLLKEGFDVDELGADLSNASISPFSSPSPPAQRGYHGLQPATPTIVPPTPSPANSASRSAAPSTGTLTSPSSSTSEVFYDAPEDPEYQTRRRSMYRSPGTASSPDLATLLRKAKERTGVSGSKDGRKGSGTSSSRDGTYSSVHCVSAPHSLCSPISIVVCPRDACPQGQNEIFAEPVCSAGRCRRFSDESRMGPDKPALFRVDEGRQGACGMLAICQGDGDKHLVLQTAKSSVRAKTSAFLGKMLGSSSTRDRSVRLKFIRLGN